MSQKLWHEVSDTQVTVKSDKYFPEKSLHLANIVHSVRFYGIHLKLQHVVKNNYILLLLTLVQCGLRSGLQNTGVWREEWITLILNLYNLELTLVSD